MVSPDCYGPPLYCTVQKRIFDYSQAICVFDSVPEPFVPEVGVQLRKRPKVNAVRSSFYCESC